MTEGVVDVGIGPRRRPDHRDLRQGGDPSAEAVELPAVRIGASERGEEDHVPGRAVSGEVPVLEDEGPTGAPPDEDGPDAPLHQAADAPRARGWARRPPAARMGR